MRWADFESAKQCRKEVWFCIGGGWNQLSVEEAEKVLRGQSDTGFRESFLSASKLTQNVILTASNVDTSPSCFTLDLRVYKHMHWLSFHPTDKLASLKSCTFHSVCPCTLAGSLSAPGPMINISTELKWYSLFLVTAQNCFHSSTH